MATQRIALLGLGEAGSLIAADLAAGGAEVCAYDPRPVVVPPGVTAVGSEAEAAQRADLVLSVNWASAAVEAAHAAAAGLKTGKLYAELNTGSPRLKRLVAEVIAPTGASFVDVGSYEALSTAITEALNPAFEVYDLEGELVAEGRVGGEAVELPMGLYRVRVLSMPVEVIENVRVPGDGSVTVNAGQ